MRVGLRVLALLLVPFVALFVVGDALLVAWGPVVRAGLLHFGWTLWVCGPVVLAVCLAVQSGDRVMRATCDWAVLFLTLLYLGMVVAGSLAPWVTLREIFRHLPHFAYGGLTLLVAAPLVVRWANGKLPKIRFLATLLGR